MPVLIYTALTLSVSNVELKTRHSHVRINNKNANIKATEMHVFSFFKFEMISYETNVFTESHQSSVQLVASEHFTFRSASAQFLRK